MFTSRYEQEGKSSIVMNVMRTMASFGKRVVLVDADLRRSELARRYRFQYGVEKPAGLAQYLAGMCPLEEATYATNLKNAYIIPAGREVLSSMQLLSSPRYEQMMTALRAHFDIILVDTPPAGLIVDAIAIAKHSDGVLVVVACNKGRKQDIASMVESIERSGCKVLGAVLDNVAAGSIASGSMQAVNGGQLFTTNTNLSNLGGSVASAFGGAWNYENGALSGEFTYNGSGTTLQGALDSISAKLDELSAEGMLS